MSRGQINCAIKSLTGGNVSFKPPGRVSNNHHSHLQGSFLNRNNHRGTLSKQSHAWLGKKNGRHCTIQPRQVSAASRQTPRQGGLPKLSPAARRTAAVFIPLTSVTHTRYATHWHATSTRKDSISCLPVTVFAAQSPVALITQGEEEDMHYFKARKRIK